MFVCRLNTFLCYLPTFFFFLFAFCYFPMNLLDFYFFIFFFRLPSRGKKIFMWKMGIKWGPINYFFIPSNPPTTPLRMLHLTPEIFFFVINFSFPLSIQMSSFACLLVLIRAFRSQYLSVVLPWQYLFRYNIVPSSHMHYQFPKHRKGRKIFFFLTTNGTAQTDEERKTFSFFFFSFYKY